MPNPAEAIIEKCGGHAIVAEICQVHISRVYRWTYTRDRGGGGGAVPSRHQFWLLAGARERGIDFSPEDLFPSRAANTSRAEGAAA